MVVAAECDEMTLPALVTDIKKRIQKIADEKGYEVQDPGTVFTAKNGALWVFVVDKVTDEPKWVLMK
jgi:hypothetical protein